jgi:hypothetical protein
MLPEGFVSVTEQEPPLWEDVLFVLNDETRVVGYLSSSDGEENEYMSTANDRRIKGVVGWMRMY